MRLHVKSEPFLTYELLDWPGSVLVENLPYAFGSDEDAIFYALSTVQVHGVSTTQVKRLTPTV